MESIYKNIFLLIYHVGFSFQEAYSLPIGLRDFYCKQLIEIKEQEAKIISGKK